MSTTMHKTVPANVVSYQKKNRPAVNHSTDHQKSQTSKIREDLSSSSFKISIIDIEKQNRLSRVISLHSKGLNQEEIARELHVDQSTISRDLQYLIHEARIKIEKYLKDDILFEYVRYMAGSNEITRHLWEIVQNSDTTTKEKTNALSCLMQSYNSRLQTLTASPESYMNIKKSLSEIDLQRLIDSSPALRAQVNQRKLFQNRYR